MFPSNAPSAARGPGGALKLPQRDRAEPDLQTFLVILWSENEVWEAFKLSQQTGRSPARPPNVHFDLKTKSLAMTDLEDLVIPFSFISTPSTYLHPLPSRKGR